MKTYFEIESNNGLSSSHLWPTENVPSTQDEMREALSQYGEWIYNAGGKEVRREYLNHWLPKLIAASLFLIKNVKNFDSAGKRKD